jgi:hypothetical protein
VDYVALLTFRSAVAAADRDAALIRRAGWTYPAGVRVIAEYWPAAAGPHVVSIFSADSFDVIMEIVFQWNDVFDVEVFPAISADEGLKIGADVFSRLPRLQQS